MTLNDIKKPHWTKNPMVWMIIFLPLTAVVAGFYTLYIAVESNDGMVDDNYYQHGLAINKKLDLEHIALAKGISGFISLNSDDGNLQVRFSQELPVPFKSTVTFKLIHRTLAGHDQKVNLSYNNETKLYTAKLRPLPKEGGLWRFQIKADDWELNQQFDSKSDEVIVLSFPPAK